LHTSLNTVGGSHTAGGSEGRDIWPVKRKREMNIVVLGEKLNEKNHFDNVTVDVIIIKNG